MTFKVIEKKKSIKFTEQYEGKNEKIYSPPHFPHFFEGGV